MTNQEAFDKVWERLVTNYTKGKCTVEGTSRCLYIREDGNRCAIGELLPDSLCRKLMDSILKASNICGISKASVNYFPEAVNMDLAIEVMDHLKGVDLGLLQDMQEVHDRWYGKGIGFVKAKLREIARRYTLVAPVPNEIEEPVIGED